MSEDFKERAQPHDQKIIQGMTDSAKAFFTGTMAICVRRTDLDRYAFYAAAVAITPGEGAREQASPGSDAPRRPAPRSHHQGRHDAHRDTGMEGQCCGWRLLTTAGHHGAVDYSPLDRWFHSSAASTEDNEVKRQVRANESTGEETRVHSYQLHNRRYLNAKLPVLLRGFSGLPELKEVQLKFGQAERRRRPAPRTWTAPTALAGAARPRYTTSITAS